jgi:3'-phosphoadenosine 5'-phosphosulfate sulfotransferase (PAPS reductase)/FAD synthetase
MTRLNAERIITLNCGLGRDSITMLALCVEGKLVAEIDGEQVTVRPDDLDCVLFSDTGCEWPSTYALIPAIQEMCDNAGIRFVILRKGDGASSTPVASWADIEAKAAAGGYHLRPAIMADLESRATVVSIGKGGDCTQNHKIDCFRRFMSDLATLRWGIGNRSWGAKVRNGSRKPHVNIVGIAADETSRLAHGGRGRDYATEVHPLVTMGIAKTDESPILARWGFDHVRKSGCYVCPFQAASWYWALSVKHPEIYAEVVAYERTALDRNPRMGATGHKHSDKSPISIPEIVAKWREMNPTATVDAVLDKQYTRCLKDAKREHAAESAALEAGVSDPTFVPADRLMRRHMAPNGQLEMF